MRAASLLLLCACTSAPPSAPMQRVVVSAGHATFEFADGRLFRVKGFNYDHDETGRLIEDYWDAEWPKIESDFAEMRELGANVVRIHLQFGRFMRAVDQPEPRSLARLRRLLALAERLDLRLDLTGLGCYHKADVPAWYDVLDEKGRWDAQAAFWEAIAKTCATSPALFCYDLMNEPVVPAPSAAEWLGPPFAGKHFVQFITRELGSRARHDAAREWIRTLVGAIRRHDARALVTVGLVDWSLDRPGLTSGFNPRHVGVELDFLSVHLYPQGGKVDDAIETLRGFHVARPVVIEETFPLRCTMAEFDDFVRRSRELSAGLIGFYWGKTPAECRASKEFVDALILQWLEYFQRMP